METFVCRRGLCAHSQDDEPFDTEVSDENKYVDIKKKASKPQAAAIELSSSLHWFLYIIELSVYNIRES